MLEETTPKPWETDRKPNTVFIGKKTIHTEDGPREIPVPNEEVPLQLTSVKQIIELPPAHIQKAGFFHPKSGFLRRAYGSLYKKPTKLDGKTPVTLTRTITISTPEEAEVTDSE